MTKDEFKKHMDSITAVFGEAEYKARMPVIYELVCDLPASNFAWICKHFLLTKSVKYPPLPEEFREAAAGQRKIITNGQREHRRIVDMPVPSGEALESTLKKLGVPSLSEAIRKRNLKSNEGA